MKKTIIKLPEWIKVGVPVYYNMTLFCSRPVKHHGIIKGKPVLQEKEWMVRLTNGDMVPCNWLHKSRSKMKKTKE